MSSVQPSVVEPENQSANPGFVLSVVTACFILSGFAALVYQTAWLRQFTLVFGSSHLAVATVLAAYMAGLALGAAIAARYVARVRRPVLVYGLLEAGIAISALCVPILLAAASLLYETWIGGRPAPPDSTTIGQPIYYLSVGFLVLALPTGFMGATLPLLASHAIRKEDEIGARISLLYASNTAGAVLGTVVTAFVLLPMIGLTASVWVGVAVNLAVFGMAAILARNLAPSTPHSYENSESSRTIGFWSHCIRPLFRGDRPLPDRISSILSRQRGWMYLLILLSGLSALYYEVLWTRMLSHVLGGSVYAFATMLAAFLTGIALGGGLAGPFAKSREGAAVGFAVSQLAIALLSAGVYETIGSLIPESRSIWAMSGLAIAVMLPATIFIGATFPLAVRTVAVDEADAATVTARVFSFNTIGAICGAVLAGFYLIPYLEFEGSIKVAVVFNLLLALWTLSFVATRRMAPLATVATLCVAVGIFYQPDRPTGITQSSILTDLKTDNLEEIFFAVGQSSTVQLVETAESFELRTNGLPEASILPLGAPPLLHPQQLLTAIPVIAQPDARRMLVIGYGGGVAIEGAPASIEEIDVVELEPEVINANRALSGRRAVDPLSDERVKVIFNDGRNALRLTTKTYDAIVSQPSHPWTAGASHLFTREFMEIAKAHLDSGGVYLQWVNSSFVDAELLKSLAATLLDVFEFVRVYRAGSEDLLFLASDFHTEIEQRILDGGRPLSEEPLHFGYMGINGAEDLIAILGLDEEGVRQFAQGAQLSTDNRNLMAMRSRYRGDGLRAPDLESLFAPFDPLLNESSWIFEDFGSQLDFVYLANRLMRLQQPERARGLGATVPDDSMRAVIAAQDFQFRGDLEQASAALNTALQIRPDNLHARYALVSLALPDFARGDASDQMRALAAGLPAAPLAVVRGWPIGASQNWAALAELDADLSRSDVTDIWYAQSVQLRAEWRIRVANDERFPREALRLIDRALLISPDLNLFVLRATAALALGDEASFVESARVAHVYMQEVLQRAESGTYQMSADYAQRSIARIEALASRLDELARAGNARAARFRDLMEVLLGQYRAFTGSR